MAMALYNENDHKSLPTINTTRPTRKASPPTTAALGEWLTPPLIANIIPPITRSVPVKTSFLPIPIEDPAVVCMGCPHFGQDAAWSEIDAVHDGQVMSDTFFPS